jgi:outer membrane biosynthesis protein TonB
MQWARENAWDILTLTSAISVSTQKAFRLAGFTEIGRMNILRDEQILLEWRRNKKKKKKEKKGEGKKGEEKKGEEKKVEEKTEEEEEQQETEEMEEQQETEETTEPQKTRKRKLDSEAEEEPNGVSPGESKRVCGGVPRQTCAREEDGKPFGEL